MFNFIKWDNKSYQIVFEKTSFYYSHRMPVALRLPADGRIMVRDEQFAKSTQDYIDQLMYIGSIVRIDPIKFKELVKTAYNKAIFAGARRIASERLHLKEENHVIKQKNNACQTTDRHVGNV